MAYESLSLKQFDAMIIRCRRALASHSRSRQPDTYGAYLAALGTVRELLEAAPSEKKAKLQALLDRYHDDEGGRGKRVG